MNKKKWIILMMLLIAFAFSACAGKTEKGEANTLTDGERNPSSSAGELAEESEPAPEPTPSPISEPTPIPDDYEMDWKDPNLEEAIRAEKGIYDRDILYSDVKGITSLYLSEKNISDISALSNLMNLKELYLGSNDISDISALSNLTSLTILRLYENNISDVSALSGLANLRQLELWDNNITDYSPVEHVSGLMK